MDSIASILMADLERKCHLNVGIKCNYEWLVLKITEGILLL